MSTKDTKETKGTKERTASYALMVVALAGAVISAQQAPDRSHPPAVGPAPSLRLPPLETRTLSNGLQVRIIGVHKVPTVHLENRGRTR